MVFDGGDAPDDGAATDSRSSSGNEEGGPPPAGGGERTRTQAASATGGVHHPAPMGPGAPPPASSLERTSPELHLELPAAAPTAAARGRSTGTRVERDPALGRYIASLQLDELDLSQLDLPAPKQPSLLTLGVALAAALAGAIALVVLTNSALYQLHAVGAWLFWAGAAAEAAVLALVGRHLAALRALAARQLEQPEALAEWGARAGHAWGQAEIWLLAWRRPLLAASIVCLAALVAFVLPHDAEWQGNTYSTAWFVAVAVAMSCGILVGRFILAQAEASPLAHDLPPWSLPPWFRWVTLALLVAGGLTASFGASWFGLGGPGSSGEFSLAGLGLAVGIGGAIWMARRFDELEAKWRAGPKARPKPSAEL